MHIVAAAFTLVVTVAALPLVGKESPKASDALPSADVHSTESGINGAIVPRSKVYQSPNCGSMIALNDGRILWLWGVGGNHPAPYPMQANFSSDGGRTWSEPEPMKFADGKPLVSFLCPSLVRLRSGKLGLLHEREVKNFNAVDAHVVATFHTSSDEGKTWSAGCVVNQNGLREVPYFDQLIQLSSGRLVMPFAFNVGPTPRDKEGHYFTIFGERFRNAYAPSFYTVTAYYSDDEGATWKRSDNEVYATVDRGLGGNFNLLEYGIAELADGRILMLGFSSVGRIFRSCSRDSGKTWEEAEPTELQGAGPMSVKRIPGRKNDVLLVWSQASKWETMNGFPRHRLSCAITSDGGLTFHSFKNLESLDDVSRIPAEPLVAYYQNSVWKQPTDSERYHRAPGPLRIDHPSVLFHGDVAIVEYGLGSLGDSSIYTRYYGTTTEELCAKFGFERDDANPKSVKGSTKVRVIPINWFYE